MRKGRNKNNARHLVRESTEMQLMRSSSHRSNDKGRSAEKRDLKFRTQTQVFNFSVEQSPSTQTSNAAKGASYP